MHAAHGRVGKGVEDDAIAKCKCKLSWGSPIELACLGGESDVVLLGSRPVKHAICFTDPDKRGWGRCVKHRSSVNSNRGNKPGISLERWNLAFWGDRAHP